MLNGFPAVGTDHAYKTLRQNAIERGNKVVWIDAHVQESAEHVDDVIRMDAREHKMPRQRRLNRDLGCLDVADLSNHDLVGVVTQNRSKAAGESKSFLFVHRNLRDTANLIFNRIFNRKNLVFFVLDLHQRGVECRRLSASRGARDKDHSIWLADVPPEFLNVAVGKTDDLEI